MQVPSLVAALGVVIAGTVGCSGGMRAPMTPDSARPPAPAWAAGDPSVLTSGPGAILLADPIPPEPQQVSADVPPLVPSYAGDWSGLSTRRACTESGGAVGVACGALPDRNRVRLQIAQAGSEARAVLTFGGERAVLTGRVHADGTLTLEGSGGSGTHTITVKDWRATVDRAGIHGTFSYVIAADDERLGSVTITTTLDGLTPVW